MKQEYKFPVLQKNILQIIKFAFIIILDATVAQLVEQLIRNQQVRGSSPLSSFKPAFYKPALFL